jgi:hypothetical protein
VFSRLLTDDSGRLRAHRVFVTVFVCVVMALLGSVLLVATPVFKGSEVLQGIWVLSCIFLLKLPLVAILWWLIWRNKELPGRRVEWSYDELAGILEHLLRQARNAARANDEEARLAYLSAEAWNIADQVNGNAKVDALTVALRIDERLARVRGQRPSGG